MPNIKDEDVEKFKNNMKEYGITLFYSIYIQVLNPSKFFLTEVTYAILVAVILNCGKRQ